MSIRPKFASEHAPPVEPVRIKFWGVRGSIPTPGPETVRFGGNTSCVEVRADGQIIILDAGSGLRPLGVALDSEFREKPQELTVLISHMHWDHIQGFPFFAPAFHRQNRIRVLGYGGATLGVRDVLSHQMEAPCFPVSLTEMRGNLAFEELKETRFQVGPVHLSACRTDHPGACYGYRLETSGGSICYVPDSETTMADSGRHSAGVAEFIRDADVVILDSQYTVEEYRERVGWGHGCLDEVVQIARDACVKNLYLFHHDPSHDDEFLDKMLHRARGLAMGSGMQVESAREGEQVLLGGPVQA